MLGALFGMSPLPRPERDRLFARLLDDTQWNALERPAKPRAGAAKGTAARKRA
jgi:hypothetical protein